MSLNNRNAVFATLAVLLLSSASSQAETPPVEAEPAEPARASTWEVLVLDGQRAYWHATRDNADAQTEALHALRTLAAAQKEARPSASQSTHPPVSATTPLSRTIKAPTFDWTLVSVGRGADGRRYAVLSDGAGRKRIAHQATLDGWTVTITATGHVTAQRGGFTIELG